MSASGGAPDPGATPGRAGSLLLLASVFAIAACGLAYELLAGTMSAYLLGNSVTQFSLVIGLFLTAMGVGSFLSRYIDRNLVAVFVLVELLVGLIGGLSALLLFTCFALISDYTPVLILICALVGILVGLEIPLLVRILRPRLSLKKALGDVLSVDYLGALAAALLFPLVLLPDLGLVRTGVVFGALNVFVAMIGLRVFRGQVRGGKKLAVGAVIALIALTAVFAGAPRTTSLLEDFLYQDDILFAKTTPYQRLVLTRWHNDFRLFINGNLQFSSVDEFRYHESLVDPVMGLVPHPQRVLILGGGDGLAAYQVLRHKGVRSIRLVDLDPAMTTMFKNVAVLAQLNHHSLSDPRLKITNEDARKFLERSDHRYDVVIIDLPDPNDESLGKLYTTSFYRLVAKHLTPVGVMVTQASSPFYTTAAFWCIANTIAATTITPGGAHLHALPYHADVPSFGDWGFVLASMHPITPRMIRLDVPTRFLSKALLPTLFVLPKDDGPRKTPINRLDNQILLRLYRNGYQKYNL